MIAVFLTTIGSTAQVALDSEVAEHARGAFDILVQPKSRESDKLASTDGLIEPDYLSFAGGGGISMAQLAAVRSVDGVGVAAPISVVGQVTGSWATPIVALPPTSASRIETFDVVQRVFDGISDRVVARESFRALLPASPTVQATSTGVGSSIGGDSRHGWLVVGLPLPPVTSSVVAVDPIAEGALVGHHVTALTQLAALRSASPTSFDAASLAGAVGDAIDHGRLSRTDIDPGVPVGQQGPVVPVMVTGQDPSTGTVDVRGSVIAEGRRVDTALRSGDPHAVLVNWPDASPLSTMDGTSPARLEPLQSPKLEIGLGTANGSLGAGGAIGRVNGLRIERPRYDRLASDGGTARFLIVPGGLVAMTGPRVPLNVDPAAQVGVVPVANREESYRATKLLSITGGATFYPVGTFRPRDLVPHSTDAGRVSLGAYDVPSIVVESSQLASRGTRMRPTLNPAGLVVRPPVAIADIRDAELMRGSRPIDAIRVRVAGIRDAGVASLHRVRLVAEGIAALGLRVRVVIGSSPQEVRLEVPRYVTSAGEIRELGTVTQRWTTMGAATTVTHGLSATTVALVILAGASALAATISAQLLEVGVTRRDSAILRITGWSRRRVARRILYAPMGISILSFLGFGTAWWLGARSFEIAVIGAGLVVATPIAALVAVHITLAEATVSVARVGDIRAPRRRRNAGSLPALALRLAGAAPLRSAALSVLVLLVTAIVGVAASVIDLRVELAGPTLLARAAIRSLTLDHGALLATSAVVGAVFAALLWRQTIENRARDDRTLTVMGWLPAERRRLTLISLCAISVPAVLGGVAIAAATCAITNPSTTGPAVLAALVAGGTLVTVMTATDRSGSRVKR